MKAQESPYGSFSDYTILQPYDTPYNDDGTLKENLKFSQDSGKQKIQGLIMTITEVQER